MRRTGGVFSHWVRCLLTPLWLASTIALTSPTLSARPYAGFSGLAASADSAATAGTNPAGATRFDRSAQKIELNIIQSESTWDGRLSSGDREVTSEDSTTLVVPSGYLVKPLNDDLAFSFTVLGFGYSDDFGNWPGRYFIESYEAVSISAFPSLAYELTDQLSVAASLSLTYASFTQERVIANLLDPGFADGSSELETDGFDVGFSLSSLYEYSDRTRFGLVYMSELDPTQDGEAKFRGLGPNTEQVLEQAGFIGADVEVKSTTPQALLLGLYHEFTNDHAITFDLIWSDFSEFELSEYYFDGEQFTANTAEWQDLWAASASYGWPVNDRWQMSVGGFVSSDMVEDEDRIFTLRLDSIWSVGIAAEWQWTAEKAVEFNFSYMTLGDAPIVSPMIPGLGSVSGEYSERDIFMLRIGLKWNSL